LAVQAKQMADDATGKPETRLAAAKVFDRLVGRLQLEDDHDGEAEETTPGDVRRFPRRA
jgi:hypothetical protein